MPTIVSGTISLLNQVAGWIIVLAPLCGGVFGGIHAIKKASSDDDMAIQKHQKMIKNAVTGTIVAMSITGIIKFVCGFYGG